HTDLFDEVNRIKLLLLILKLQIVQNKLEIIVAKLFKADNALLFSILSLQLTTYMEPCLFYFLMFFQVPQNSLQLDQKLHNLWPRNRSKIVLLSIKIDIYEEN
ncbi:hypothetical protein BDFB_011143, partial [Asbolus verrucosus]